METPPESGGISAWRLAGILARMSLRRMGNRFSGIRLFRKPRVGKRVGKPLKGRPSVIFPLFLGLVFCWQSLMISGTLLAKLETALKRRAGGAEPVMIPANIYNLLESDARFVELGWDEESRMLESWIDGALAGRLDVGSTVDREMILKTYREKGLVAFETEGKRFPNALAWKDPIPKGSLWLGEYAVVVALVLLILLVNVVTTGMGPTNQDLGKVEWSFEWLFTFPVSTRVLFTGRLLDYTLTNFYGWMLFVWFSAAFFFRLGAGWLAIPCALVVGLCLNALAGAIRLVAETWMRLRFPMSKIKNVQALCSILSLVSIFILFVNGLGQGKPDWMVKGIFALDFWRWLVPFTLPAFAASGLSLPIVIGLMVAATVPICLGAITLTARLARFGLVSSPGVHQGTRGRSVAPTSESARPLFAGVLRKDFLLLCRDRNLFTGIFIVPFFIIGIQLFMNSGLLTAAMGNTNHAAAVAFGIGAYILLTAGANVMASEGHALWILYTFPMPLEVILRRKLIVMLLVGVLYTGATLAVFAAKSPSWDWSALPVSLMALLGIVIYSYISGGIGVLGYNPLATEPRHRMRISSIYFYMLLAAIYGYGLYSPALTQKLAAVVLSSFLAYAIWQKVRDQLPYMLDPGELPPPRLTLSFAMTAAFFFYLVQSLVTGVIVLANKEKGAEFAFGGGIIIAFAIAGVVVGGGSLLALHFRKIPDWPREIGLRSGRKGGVLAAVLIGPLAGFAAAGIAFLYVRWVGSVESLREAMERANTLQGKLGPWWMMALLAVVAAPLCEEFLFRGLVFRSLRRTLPLTLSVIASAAIFAVIHPGISMAPVFVLGVAAAFSLEFTGLLLAPVLAHVCYNGVVMFLIQ
jgi:ABC-2 type transport system permease protein